ncbi:YicC/YloC family endoribonuclease [Polynucleobacter necessarius]|uniref:YicC/YloC family endoribonuclease n=1 Tax=Polynucleobacter necessarius TaxID=576610 RepID=UPI001E394853|nr:YicC/YloC family endoribonuclease [Polynucleobacter necessarius]
MTGYGSASRQVSLGAGVVADLQVECRTVNSRFLDLGFRLPDECRGAEPALREMVSQSLARGKVEFRAAWRVNSGAADATRTNPHAFGAINRDRLDALNTLQEKAQEAFPKAQELSISEVLRWPGVISEPRAEEDSWIASTIEAGRAAMVSLIERRHAEGSSLVEVLTSITSKMCEILKVIEPKVPEYVAQYQAKLTERLAEVLAAQERRAMGGAELMERIRQEVVLYAVRIDVAEEFARLKTHLQAVDAALAGKGPVGKRLDFLMQELNREANTLSSKSVSTECTQAALELKLLIEQMREQVQNLE